MSLDDDLRRLGGMIGGRRPVPDPIRWGTVTSVAGTSPTRTVMVTWDGGDPVRCTWLSPMDAEVTGALVGQEVLLILRSGQPVIAGRLVRG